MARRFILLFWILSVAGAFAPGVAADPMLDAVNRALDRLSRVSVDPLSESIEATADVALESREHLAVARSIRSLEANVDSTTSVLEADVLPLLSLARNYRHLGMRVRALVWYDRADLADHSGSHEEFIVAERAECIAEMGDPQRVCDALDNLLMRSKTRQWSVAMEPLLAAARDFADREDLTRILAEIEAIPSPMDTESLWRVAQLRMQREEFASAVVLFGRLVLREDELGARAAARALKGLADSNFLSGDRETSRRLYQSYRDADTGRLSAWATYQLGSIAVLDRDYERAEDYFRSICERPEVTNWSQEACTRLEQTRQLLALENDDSGSAVTVTKTEESR